MLNSFQKICATLVFSSLGISSIAIEPQQQHSVSPQALQPVHYDNGSNAAPAASQYPQLPIEKRVIAWTGVATTSAFAISVPFLAAFSTGSADATRASAILAFCSGAAGIIWATSESKKYVPVARQVFLTLLIQSVILMDAAGAMALVYYSDLTNPSFQLANTVLSSCGCSLTLLAMMIVCYNLIWKV